MAKSTIAFIINPNSGTNNKKDLPDLIRKILDADRFDISIEFTKYAGHGKELAKQYAEKGFNYVVACGGDGTINEVASQLTGTNTVFGIIPYGSGNGLARHLGISLIPKRALRQINKHSIKSIDYGMANEHAFFCTCGTGFDAHISHKFAVQGKRGFFTYLKTVVKEYWGYKPHPYTLSSDEFEITQRAFVVTIANASQYGNNAFIAPQASTSDGLLDICILKPFPFYSIPWLAFLLFQKEIERSKHISILRTKGFTLKRKKEGEFHIDGDPIQAGKEISIKVVPNGLKVMMGRTLDINVILRARLIYAKRRFKSHKESLERTLKIN